jgi:hypothetical protein
MSEYVTLREAPSTRLCQTKAVSSGKLNRFTETPRGSPSARALQIPHVPPSFAQCLQHLQFLQALHGSDPVLRPTR